MKFKTVHFVEEKPYWTNKFGGRFASEELAAENEKLREETPWKVRNLEVYLRALFGRVSTAIDDTGKPFTGQRDDKSEVYLFKNMIEGLQAYVNQYGDNVGFCHQHRGMGSHSDMVVVLEPNNP